MPSFERRSVQVAAIVVVALLVVALTTTAFVVYQSRAVSSQPPAQLIGPDGAWYAGIPAVVMTVADEQVAGSELDTTLRLMQLERELSGQEPISPSSEEGVALARQATERLFTRTAVRQAAVAENLSADPAEVQAAREKLDALAVETEYGTLAAAMQRWGVSEQQLDAELEVQSLYTQLAAATTTPVTDEEIRAYYDANPDEFTMPDQRPIEALRIDYDPDAEVGPREQQAAERLRDQLRAGTPIDTLASADKTVEVIRTDFQPAAYPEQVADAVMALAPDAVSDPIELGGTLVVVRATGPVSSGELVAFDAEVGEQIRKELERSRRSEALRALTDEKRAATTYAPGFAPKSD